MNNVKIHTYLVGGGVGDPWKSYAKLYEDCCVPRWFFEEGVLHSYKESLPQIVNEGLKGKLARMVILK